MRLRLALCVLLVFVTVHAAVADVVISGRRETKITVDPEIEKLMKAMPMLVGLLGQFYVMLGIATAEDLSRTLKELQYNPTPTRETFTISLSRDRMHVRSSDNKGFSGEMTVRLEGGRARYHLVAHREKLSARFDVERGVATNFRGLPGVQEVGIVGLPNLSSAVMKPTGETKQMLGAEARRYAGEVVPYVRDFSEWVGFSADSSAVEFYSGYKAEAWVASPDSGAPGVDEVQEFFSGQALTLLGGGSTPLGLSMAGDAAKGIPLHTVESLYFLLDIRFMGKNPFLDISTTTTITSVEVTEVPDWTFDDTAPADYTPVTLPGSGGTGGGDSGVAAGQPAAGPGGAGGGGAAAAGPAGPGAAGAPPSASQSTPPPCDCSCAGFKTFQELSKSADKKDPKAEAAIVAAAQCARQCMMRWVACTPP